ncbi:hypothetical protein AMECASPLE_034760 [Ameca splendens]|uniref:Uncharacterized protein n=1 Tax=Ameca splendens TaxID=208324 RepID=A0ABV1A3X5_9TELE
MKNRLVDSITRRKLISLDIEPLWVSTEVQVPAPGVSVVFDPRINLLIFSYQTDFQLSSSSRNGLVEQKFACELLSLQICASDALSCEMATTLSPQPVLTLGDVRAATSVELRMSKGATKMDDPNTIVYQRFRELGFHLYKN